MNDEMTNVFLRLEEIASNIRGFAAGSAEASDPHSGGGQREDIADRHKAQGTKHGTYSASPKSGTQAHAQSQDLEMVEAMISIRGLRDRYFEGDLFFDPAWSMLIDLYRADLKGENLSVTSVCIGSGVADTTALRYVRALEDREYIHRVPDPQDRRRAFVRLTAKAREKLDAYFEKVNVQCRAA